MGGQGKYVVNSVSVLDKEVVKAFDEKYSGLEVLELIRCKGGKLESMRSETDYIIIEDVHEEIIHKRKAWLAMAIFAGLIGAATMGLAEIMVCAMTAAFLMVITGCLQMRDVYRSLQGGVLLLIAGTIALGAAMEKTGTSQLYAGHF